MTQLFEAGDPAADKARSRIRGAKREDAAGVMRLFQRHGWPLRSEAGWNWALFDNPARRELGCEAGWVLESAGQVVGFLGHVPTRFHSNGQVLFGATCTSLLVDPDFRAPGMGLVRAFTAQPSMALLYSATANSNSAPLYKIYGYRPPDDPGCNERLRWILSHTEIARALLERIQLDWVLPRPGFSSGWRKLLAPERAGEQSGSESGLVDRAGHVDRVTVSDLTHPRNSTARDAWNAWAAELSMGPGLWNDRRAETMCWRLKDPDLDENDQALFALRDSHGRMLGSSLVRRLPVRRGQPAKAELVDLALLPHCGRAAVGQLLKACRCWAKSSGAAVLDAKRWTGERSHALSAWAPRRSPLPSDALWFRQGRSLGGGTIDWKLWSMTGLDSDDWFNTLRTELPPSELPSATESVQAESAAVSARCKSSNVSTLAGSKNSMSMV